jgi:hypothetical protein
MNTNSRAFFTIEMINIFLGYKCNEQNLVVVICKDVFDEDVYVSHLEEIPQENDPTPPSNLLEVEPVISLNTLVGFSPPQTLKLTGYIKDMKFIILVDSGITHNFIHHDIAQEINYYIFPFKKI